MWRKIKRHFCVTLLIIFTLLDNDGKICYIFILKDRSSSDATWKLWRKTKRHFCVTRLKKRMFTFASCNHNLTWCLLLLHVCLLFLSTIFKVALISMSFCGFLNTGDLFSLLSILLFITKLDRFAEKKTFFSVKTIKLSILRVFLWFWTVEP